MSQADTVVGLHFCGESNSQKEGQIVEYDGNECNKDRKEESRTKKNCTLIISIQATYRTKKNYLSRNIITTK